MTERKPWIATIDVAAMQQLQEFVRAQNLSRLLVVADSNTWKAQGEAVVEADAQGVRWYRLRVA